MRVPTVIINTDNGPVTINKSDFDPATHTLFEGAPAADDQDSAPTGDGDQGGTETQQTGETQPVTLLVTKKGKKFVVVDGEGNAVQREGIDADGYAAENDAWAAIMAVNAVNTAS